MEAITKKSELPPKRVSFRDPSGSLYLGQDKVVRVVNERGWNDLSFAFNSPRFHKHVSLGNIIPTWKVSTSKDHNILHHPKVFFPSYPDEWVPEMLNNAASLTLTLAEELMNDGLGLKDATPRNVLFSGSKSVFIDVLSFEKRHPNDATWKPFEQFCRTFLYPLISHRALGISLKQSFANHYNGPLAEELLPLLSPLQRIHPRYFSLVTVPALLSNWTNKAKEKGAYSRFTSSKEEAQFVLKILVKHLRRGLERIAPQSISTSTWNKYVEKNCPYNATELAIKKTSIETFLKFHHSNSLLDLGCNTGTFSILGARLGKTVVSVDGDAPSISHLYQKAQSDGLNILPLHIDLLNPTPARGWNGSETLSFLERSKESFDTVMLLALIHHLMGDGISLEDIMALAANLTKNHAIIEYIPPTDGNFKRIIAKRGDTVAQPTVAQFENCAAEFFNLLSKETVSESGRTLYFLEKKRT